MCGCPCLLCTLLSKMGEIRNAMHPRVFMTSPPASQGSTYTLTPHSCTQLHTAAPAASNPATLPQGPTTARTTPLLPYVFPESSNPPSRPPATSAQASLSLPPIVQPANPSAPPAFGELSVDYIWVAACRC